MLLFLMMLLALLKETQNDLTRLFLGRKGIPVT